MDNTSIYERKVILNFQTDGDYYWNYVPRGMSFDGLENYTYENTWDAQSDTDFFVDIQRILQYLIENVRGIDWVVKGVREMLSRMLDAIRDGKTSFKETMEGNYDGTEVEYVTNAKVRFTIVAEKDICDRLAKFTPRELYNILKRGMENE